MSKATFVPAVTETKTIEVAPAKVVLELTIEDAQVLRALLGETAGTALWGLFNSLGELHDANNIPRLSLKVTDQSIKLDTQPYAY